MKKYQTNLETTVGTFLHDDVTGETFEVVEICYLDFTLASYRYGITIKPVTLDN